MSTRFSKSTLGAWMYFRVRHLEKEWGFTRDNGYAQVRGKGEEANRAYGEWYALWSIIEEYEL